jgi:hypothetical protein
MAPGLPTTQYRRGNGQHLPTPHGNMAKPIAGVASIPIEFRRCLRVVKAYDRKVDDLRSIRLAKAKSETVRAGGSSIEATRLRITDAGRRDWLNNRAAGQRPSRWRRAPER